MGDKICAWIMAEMPGLTSWVGTMSEGQIIAFAAIIMLFAYALYAIAAYLLTALSGETYYECEGYEPWMDEELWHDP